MNLLGTGDWHLRASRPQGRRDDFVRTMQGKITELLSISERYKCHFILQPGDFYDGALEIPMWLLRLVIHMLRPPSGNPDILCVPGQHDMRYHSKQIDNTPLAVTEASRAVRILGAMPFVRDDVAFYGAGWDDDIPRATAHHRNILLIHKMIVGPEKLWSAQEGHEWASSVLKQNQNFDLVISGDNHQFFVEEHKGRFLVNCGSLMRSTIAQTDHKPSVVIYDTDKARLEVIPLTIAPAMEVLDVEAARTQERRNAEMDAFIEHIRGDTGPANLNFLEIVHRLSRMEGVDPGVATMVDRIVAQASQTTHKS